MFVDPTNEKEIINIVSAFNNKQSEYLRGISMAVLKSIMINIVKPNIYRANLSLNSGVFLISLTQPQLFCCLRKVLCTMLAIIGRCVKNSRDTF